MRLRGDVGLVGLSAKASTSDSFASQEAGAVLQTTAGQVSLWVECLQPDGKAITNRSHVYTATPIPVQEPGCGVMGALLQ